MDETVKPWPFPGVGVLPRAGHRVDYPTRAALGTGETLTVWKPTSAGGNSHPAILGGLLYLERWLIFFESAM